MPVYNYTCTECGEQFSKLLKIDDRDEPVNAPCPECKTKHTVHRTVEAPSFIYNPSGTLRTSDNFNDRLMEIKKTKGRDNTINTRRSAV